jgi:hypothetical protein
MAEAVWESTTWRRNAKADAPQRQLMHRAPKLAATAIEEGAARQTAAPR